MIWGGESYLPYIRGKKIFALKKNQKNFKKRLDKVRAIPYNKGTIKQQSTWKTPGTTTTRRAARPAGQGSKEGYTVGTVQSRRKPKKGYAVGTVSSRHCKV